MVALPTSVETFYGVASPPVPGTGTALNWWIFRVSGGVSGGDPFVFHFGDGSWLPVTGDWGGFGQSGVGAFDPSTDTWHLAGPPGLSVTELSSFQFGRADCTSMPRTGPNLVPLVFFMGDWVGRGRAGVGVYDPSSGFWCLKNLASSGTPDAQFQFAEFGAADVGGLFGATTSVRPPLQIPVVGDWDGNGTTTVGVYDQTLSLWLLRNENSQGPADGGTIQFPTLLAGTIAVGLVPITANWTGTRTTGLGVDDLGPNTISTLTGKVTGTLPSVLCQKSCNMTR